MGYNVLSRQQRKLTQKGVDPKKAMQIAYYTQKKKGRVAGSVLNEAGQEYSNYTPAQRAILRYAEQRGIDPNKLEYIDGRVKRNKMFNLN